MKIYLVGGAVRDKLLNRPILEKDWLVVGETVESMQAAGFQQVGKDFPVFLHPKTKEEYALARKERKIAKGYHGFEFDANSSVSLEEDLLRRDLTINAIAEDSSGKRIDPYGGQDDLNQKILRHVSPAFSEDPVRILRLARFSARFPDFSIAKVTEDLMINMVKSGEVNALVPERVWKEFEKAMIEIAPWKFFDVLDRCAALEILFPIFYEKKEEIFTRLISICSLTKDLFSRIILLMLACNDLEQVKKICLHYRAHHSIFDFVQLISQHEKEYKNIKNISPQAILKLFHELDAFRRPQRFYDCLNLCKLLQEKDENQEVYLLTLYHSIKKIDLPPDVLKENKGKAVGEYIEKQRLKKIDSQSKDYFL